MSTRASERSETDFDLEQSDLQGLSYSWLLLVFLLVLLLNFSRRPQDLYHATFYAEDGKRWFAQAYNLGWFRSLSIPDASYLQILPRLAAGCALWVPLRLAPLVLNLAGAAVQASPVLALLSRRCAQWGPLSLRMGLSVLYVVIPNAREVHVAITNAQWHLALLLTLLAFATPPRTWSGKALDVLLFLIGALSGPFCLVIAPALFFFWWRKRERWSLILLACLAMGVLVQGHTILTSHTYAAPYEAGMPIMPARIEAERTALGATPVLLLRIIGGDIVLNSMIGYGNALRFPVVLCVLSLLFGSVIIGFGLYYGSLGFRLFAFETLILTAAALKTPVIFADSMTRWSALAVSGGIRYYFFPSLLFLWAAAYCVTRAPHKSLRVAGYVVFILMLLGIARRWEYPPLAYGTFSDSVNHFNHASPGERITIPIAPVPWTMTLIKH